jgi:hypothetical protein
LIKSHLCYLRVSYSVPFPGQAGTDRARSRAICITISFNNHRDTATSTFWNVTSRPCLTTFAPTLICFSLRLVSDVSGT